MIVNALFFPMLKRRGQYSSRKNGDYHVYSRYKQEIREDCLGRCVYCDVHENENGGPETMNLDHFRPKKYEEFVHLFNDPNNLVWSCSGCNRLKSDEWPALGTPGTFIGNEGFLDPFVEDRRDYFVVSTDGEIRAQEPPAGYMLELLALNRASRKRIRELRHLKQSWLQEFEQEIAKLLCLLQGPNLADSQKTSIASHVQWLQSKMVELQTMFFDFDLH